MTYYGVNPSFVNGRLPLFTNGIMRDRYFRVFRDNGDPTDEKSVCGPDGWPINDGRMHGVKVFSEMAGTMPECTAPGLLVRQRAGDLFWVYGRDLEAGDSVKVSGKAFRSWHIPSLAELGRLQPTVLRTLDWERTNDKPEWSKPRVLPTHPIQGNGMAVELQAEAANLLKCNLWWCAPARFELSREEYERRLEEKLEAIRGIVNRPPVLQYSNELWNSGFAVHNWLKRLAAEDSVGPPWHYVAAAEIALLRKVADRVFGKGLGSTYYLFVDGQLTVPSHLRNLLEALSDLGVQVDMAGPALYATPLKASKESWESLGTIPTQDELRQSVEARLPELEALLSRTAETVSDYGVPYLGVYEAGQSLIAGHHPWRRAALDAQGQEWMGDVYRELRRIADACDVTVMNWYSAMTDQQPKDSRVDVFGLLEGMGKAWSPKALAAIGQ